MNAEQIFLAAVAFFSVLLIFNNRYFIERDAQTLNGAGIYVYLAVFLTVFAIAFILLRTKNRK